MSRLPRLCDLLIHNVHLATMNPEEPRAEVPRYGTIHKGALLVHDDKIVWLGREADLPQGIKTKKTIDGQQQWLLPGFVDCHTHLIYAGDRSGEFEQRQDGISYEQITQNGGGILSTVQATRSASEEALLASARPRVAALLSEGVTTLEIKSGYGLDTPTELKMLRVAARLEKEFPVTIMKTFLGAHTVPPEFKNRPEQYIDHICQDMLPTVAQEQLADAVDVFCEHIAFTVEQTERVFQAAKALGLPVKLHGEQLSYSGGTELAVSYKALSADHLEYLDEQGVAALHHSGTIATLLPGAFYCLRERQLPPIDLLRRRGIPIAIASDLNPGTSPIASIRMIMHLACTLFRLTPAEALAGCTSNGAKALGLQNSVGMLKEGMDASMVLWPVTAPASLAADLTGIKPRLIFYKGKVVDLNQPSYSQDEPA